MEMKIVTSTTEAQLGSADNKYSEESAAAPKTTWWTKARIYIVVASVLVVVGLALGLGLGLGLKSSGDVVSLDIPFLKPPVYSASPTGLKSRRRLLRNESHDVDRLLSQFTTSSAMTTLKSRLFTSGPGDFNYRLGLVDNRLQEFKTRALESNRVCLSTSASLFSPTLPNLESFPMYFSCKEKMSDSLNVYFGQKDGKYYVAELTTGSPSIGVLASVDSAGTVVDVWQIMADSTSTPKTASVFHINADKTSGTIQVIGAASYVGTGVGCGIKMSSTSSAMWFYGNPSDNGSPSPCPTDTTTGDYLASVVSGDWQSFCVDPSTLTDISSSLCTTLSTSFPQSDFSYAQLVSDGYGATAYTLISSPTLPSGLVDFNEIDDTTS